MLKREKRGGGILHPFPSCAPLLQIYIHTCDSVFINQKFITEPRIMTSSQSCGSRSNFFMDLDPTILNAGKKCWFLPYCNKSSEKAAFFFLLMCENGMTDTMRIRIFFLVQIRIMLRGRRIRIRDTTI